MTTNDTPNRQHGMCKHCDKTLSRQPGAHLWLTALGDEKCAAAPSVDGDPGRHVPRRVLDRLSVALARKPRRW